MSSPLSAIIFRNPGAWPRSQSTQAFKSASADTVSIRFGIKRIKAIEEFLDAAKLGDKATLLGFLHGPIKSGQLGIDVQNIVGHTALHEASTSGQLELVQALLQAGANANEQSFTREIALHGAVRSGSLKVVQALLQAQANPDLPNSDDFTPLHIATIQQRGDIAQALLSAKANPNAKNKWGLTPLHLAAQRGNIEIVRLLLQANADVTLKDKKGKTALEWATYAQHPLIISLILQATPPPIGFSPSEKKAYFRALTLQIED